MMVRIIGFVLIVSVYVTVFFLQERMTQETLPRLAPTLPAKVQKVASGYMYQLLAEMLYIKTTVFLGGREPGQDPQGYAPSLTEHFSAISTLHPNFLDTYFLCESSLSSLGPEYARHANTVLEKGITGLPDNWILPFFKGFNHFRYLDEPREAAVILHSASRLPKAPALIGHLASVLSAQGGDIYAGLMWLKAMLATEEDEMIQKRYRKEIAIFEDAVRVLKAIQEYRNTFHHPPMTLDVLVPNFIPQLPEIKGNFILSWTPPTLRLIRPDPEQNLRNK